MRRSAPPRIHRLPQRLDYTLIPAPLDLTLPLVDEKAPLPAIIVTPSSPSHEGDFSIAFLVPPSKPSPFQRLTNLFPTLPSVRSYLPSQIQLPPSPFKTDFEEKSPWSFKTRTRVIVILGLLLFVVACHFVMHRFLTGRTHMEFGIASDNETNVLGAFGNPDTFGTPVDLHNVEDMSPPTVGGWFDLNALWAPTVHADAKRDPGHIL